MQAVKLFGSFTSTSHSEESLAGYADSKQLIETAYLF